ncbi:pyrroline-5-carboxylate reductase [Halarcobacter ebronensis]|uniref:Pyrroline-5-carboxylate reductase n=1 Tax=Halarcobacter ebronensis TaxID=1462615 RepID=A0A4Q1ATV1_9BACT|nr:pyrroline-5-carboxylate reductase [Halarcobacter ebronensis]QKF81262.1 pyrroline-5-carboxylate reductase [Halarcobacter ebronensis]RXK04828.1 pyrroline-5-carboxylate reductase [Halarcobacter ebronensis]
MKLTLIGNGFMAQALAKGLVNNFEVEVIGRDINKLEKLKQYIPKIEIKELSDIEDITNKNIIFCVKPYALQSVAARLEGNANILFSILAGTTLESLKKQIKAKYYIRTMPNVAASVKKSATTITGDKEAAKVALDIFSLIGKAIWVDTEKQLDIATAVAGSGPAFLALIAESMTDGAVKAGLDRKTSSELVHGLFEGFSELLKSSHPAIIKDSVMSPGGTTAAGVAVLEEGAIRSNFIKAVEAAHNKAIEIGKK